MGQKVVAPTLLEEIRQASCPGNALNIPRRHRSQFGNVCVEVRRFISEDAGDGFSKLIAKLGRVALISAINKGPYRLGIEQISVGVAVVPECTQRIMHNHELDQALPITIEALWLVDWYEVLQAMARALRRKGGEPI